MANEKHGRHSLERKWLTVFLVSLFLVSGPLALHATRFVFASPSGFNISSQSTLQLGQTINLTGTVCPNPSNTFEFVVTVNYTGPAGQVVSKTEQIGYGQMSLCSSPFTIDSGTMFNSTGSWQVQAQAQWTDSNDVSQTMNSNSFDFTVVNQQTTTTTSASYTTTSSASTVTSNSGSISTTTNSATSSTSSCAFITGTCAANYVSNANSYFQNVSLSANSVANIQFNITEPSYLGYNGISSSAAIEEAVVSSTQLYFFEQYGGSFCDGSAASYSASCGYQVLNGLLMYPGSYNLLVYTKQSPTQVYFGYNASLGLKVQNATTFVGAFIPLDSDSEADFVVHPITLGSPTTIQLFGISTLPVNYEIVDLLHNSSVVFHSPDLTTTNLNGTMPQQNVEPFYYVSLPVGLYGLVITNMQSSTCNAYFEYQLTPAFVNPYYISLAGEVGLYGPSTSKPMGVASYGIYNNSNTIIPFQQPIMSQGVAGATSIDAIKVGDNTNPTPPYDATNQLNAVLVVQDKDGASYVYWPQNVIKFDTVDNVLLFSDDLFNLTGDGAYLTNASVTSSNGGFVNSYGSYEIFNNMQYYLNGHKSYTLPLSYTLTITDNVVPGTGVAINMSDYIVKGLQQTGYITFDHITIHDPNIQTAYFYVSGSEYTPAGLSGLHVFYDVENIFGGGGGGSEASFTAFKASVNVGYYNQQSQNYTVFPSAYTFGEDTAETAANIHATYNGNGVVGLSLGTANWQYIYGSSSSVTTSGHTSPGQIASTKVNHIAAPSSDSYLIVGVLLAAIGGGAVFLLRRRRAIPPPP